MISKNILICHSSSAVLDHLAKAVSSGLPDSDVLLTDNLTTAYNLAEHKEPQHILVDEQLAATREFELLHSLVNILKIECWVIGDKTTAPHCAAFAHMRFIPPQATASQIIDCFRRSNVAPVPDAPRSPAARDHIAFREGSMILIGASTGGVDALANVLSHFSPVTPPTFIVQHTGGSFTKSLIRLLDNVTDARVRPAVDGETPKKGHVYLAPGDETHLCLTGKTAPRIALRHEGLLSGHRPSIDALFRSAKPFAARVSAALLTGMGQDGARGLLMLREAGVQTIGQDAATSVVYGMPRVAKEMGAVSQQLPLQKIGPALLADCSTRVRA